MCKRGSNRRDWPARRQPTMQSSCVEYSLDLHGVVPSADQAATFLKSRNPEKRSQLIEELLASPRFGEHFADVWRGRLLSPAGQ
jgi:hypothetical protein